MEQVASSGGPAGTGRWVLHLDMDAFFASVEQLTRPTLRGRPVLVGGSGQRGVVAGASYEARVFGARSAMPMHQARRLVGPTAVVLPPRGSVYRVASERVFAAVRGLVPVIEQLSLDEAFGEPAELAGAESSEVEAFCTRLRDAVYERTGLVASVGAGSGKQIAKIASGLAKPHGQRVIRHDEQDALLAQLPARKLWGIGPVAEERLRRVGVETIGDLAALDDVEVASLLGSSIGPALHRLAQGIDDRPVAERAESKQISAEMTFPHDLMTRSEVRAAVQTAGEAAHTRLAHDGRGARTVVVKLRKADMSILTRSSTMPHGTTAREPLLAAAQRLVLDPAQIGPIRLVGVSFAGLSSVEQATLFDAEPTDSEVPGAPEATEGTAAPPETEADAVDPSAPELGVQRGRRTLDRAGADVRHREFGHGWVQGAGHGVVSVRFETRSSGPGYARTFAVDDPDLALADPLDSLDWPVEPQSVDGGAPTTGVDRGGSAGGAVTDADPAVGMT